MRVLTDAIACAAVVWFLLLVACFVFRVFLFLQRTAPRDACLAEPSLRVVVQLPYRTQRQLDTVDVRCCNDAIDVRTPLVTMPVHPQCMRQACAAARERV